MLSNLIILNCPYIIHNKIGAVMKIEQQKQSASNSSSYEHKSTASKTKKSQIKKSIPDKKKNKIPLRQTILKFRSTLKPDFGSIVQIPCYQQSQLNWPHQFTDELPTHRIDNDIESSQYIVQRQKKQCVQNLFCEVTMKRMLEMADTIGF